jgi:ferric-dicitrate binding protein FerR (iron transport regulator)
VTFWRKRRERAACAGARDAELLGTADAATVARVSRHVARCPACQAERARLEALKADVRVEPAPLDDLTRARILDRLIPALDDLAAGRARVERQQPRRRAIRWLPLAGATVAAGVLAVALGPTLRPPLAPLPGTADRADRVVAAEGPVGRTAPPLAPAPAAAPEAPDPLALIRPEDDRAGDPAVRRLVIAEGVRRKAWLGERTHLLLVGPAELEVASATPELLEVRLARGTLVGHYRHGSRGRLRVLSPSTRTDVVGTTFYVEAGAGGSRVAVARGRVLVRGEGERERLVSAGQVWSSTAAIPAGQAPGISARLPGAIARLFAEQAEGEARSLRSPTEPAPRPHRSVTATGRSPTPAAQPEAPPPPLDPGPAPPGAPDPTAVPAGQDATAAAAPAEAVPPPPPAVSTAEVAAADLYRQAEQAMSRGDRAEARRRLLELASLPQAGALGPVAAYELAQLALGAGDLDEARARLDWVRVTGAPALAEPAAFLGCEVELRAGAREDARRCYTRFRARHPGSVQDAEALGALLRLSPVSGDCADGRALLDEYLTRHPDGPLAGEARRRRRACGP